MSVMSRTILVSATVAVGLSAAGCRDADNSAEPNGDAAVSPASTVSASSHPYCDIERRIDEHFDAGLSTLETGATEQQQLAAAQTTAQAIVAAGLLDEAEANAPDAIRADLDVLIAGVNAAAEGDVLMLFTPETDQAGSRVGAFCGRTD